MAIADTITSMQTHTSNAYDMLSNGTDLTGINKNLENLSSTIFEAFLEALRNPDTLFTNLPKTSGSGSQITLNGTAYAPMRITLNPTALSQTTYTGKNQIGMQNLSETTRNGLTFSINNGILSVNGTASAKVNFQQVLASLTQTTSKTLFLYLDSGTFTAGAMGIHLDDSSDSQVSFIQITYNTTDLKSTKTLDLTNVSKVWIYAISGSIFTNAKFRIMLSDSSSDTYEPYVGGTASPNPLYPQDIHTISGNNSVVVEGKNLFTIDNYVSKNGWNITLNNPLKGMEAGYYTISCVNEYPTSGKGSAVIFSNEVNGNRVGGYFTGYDFGNTRFNNSINVTQEQINAEYIIFTPGDSALTQETLGNMKIQIEKGSTATTYEPYQSNTQTIDLTPYNLGSIGNYENKFIRSGGENSFNSSFETKTTSNITFSYDSGIITLNNTTASTTGTIILNDTLNDTLPKGTYTCIFQYISGTASGGASRVSIGDSNVGIATDNEHRYFSFVIANGNTSNMVQTITINEDKIINKWGFYVNSGITYTNYKFRLYIVKGTYTTSNIPDYIPYEKGWYYKQGIGKVVLDGTEDWQVNGTGTPNYFYYYYSGITTGDNNLYCNCYSYASIGASNTNIGIFLPSNYVRIRNASEDTLANFKSQLSNTNAIVYYILATPTYTKITGELANQLEQVYKGMLSYDGTTNISQVNNDLAFVINASGILGE